MIDRVKEVATKPFVFVLGHNHPDHKGAMAYADRDGVDIYVADRCGPQGTGWKIEECNHEYTSGNPVIDKTYEGTYDGDNIHIIDEGYVFDLGNCKLETYRLPGHCDDLMILYDRANGLMFSSDIYAVNRYWVADQFGASGVKQDLLLSLQQQLMDEYNKDGGQVKELYTGHNRVGVGGDYLAMWENCLQNVIDFGPSVLTHDRRGDGSLVSTDGNQYETMTWTSFGWAGKLIRAEYTGEYDGQKFYHFEIDYTGENALPESRLLYDWKTNAHLSNIRFADAELVGHEFNFKTGMGTDRDGNVTEETKLEDGRLKYVLLNKFVPYDTEYDVKIAAGQKEVTLTAIAMSNRVQALTVNGEAASNRCPVTVPTDKPCEIEVTGPDGSEKMKYTFTFVEA
jgi:glyoxylase-like metal-dependent hydrolase (beta-lactamase superfamily II)